MALSVTLRNACKLAGGRTICPYYTKNLAPFSQFANTKRPLIIPNTQTNTLLKNQTLKSLNLVCAASTTQDHSKLWVIEKVISIALVPMIPLAIAYPNALFDNLLVLLTVPHIHWGLENVAHDYIRPVIFGALIPKIADMAIYAISAFLLGALFYFNFSDVGIGRLIRKLWAVNKKN